MARVYDNRGDSLLGLSRKQREELYDDFEQGVKQDWNKEEYGDYEFDAGAATGAFLDLYKGKLKKGRKSDYEALEGELSDHLTKKGWERVR